MRFSLRQLAGAVNGTIMVGGTEVAVTAEPADEVVDRVVDGLSIDSRSIEPGSLFVPLVAERDGHDFIGSALDRGAAAFVCSRNVDPGPDHRLVPRLCVSDTDRALEAIGRLARRRLSGPVIGITGSVGKTSVKDLALAACSRPGGPDPFASEKSFNNEIGVPLTLANAPDDGAAVLVEMGARGVGHIRYLCELAQPTVGVVTAVALAHTELFGSIEAVAQGKGELVESLPDDGMAVLNADNPWVADMARRTSARVLRFGLGPGVTVAGVTGREESPAPDVAVVGLVVETDLRPTVTFETTVGSPDGTGRLGGERGEPRRRTITLPVRGAHMAVNAAAAVAVAVATGVEFDRAVDNLASVRLSPWRMEVLTAPGKAVIINDAYNANPTSMRAALAALVDTGAGRTIAVVGEMAELGDERVSEHRAVAHEAAAVGIRVIAVSAPDYGPSAAHVDTIEQARAFVGDLDADTAVLVKGSRVAGLERLAQSLVATAPSPGGVPASPER